MSCDRNFGIGDLWNLWNFFKPMIVTVTGTSVPPTLHTEHNEPRFQKVTFSQQNMTTSPFVSFCLLPNNFSRKPRPSGRASTQSTRSMAEL